MRWGRVKTIVVYAWHHLTHSMETWVDIFWFPIVSALVFSGIGLYFGRIAGATAGQLIIMGTIFWYTMESGSYSVAVGVLWEIWSRSFSSMFVSPLTIEEFVAGHMIFGFFKQILIFTVLSLIGYFVFHFSILSVGATLPIHLLLIMLFGNVVGIFILGVLLRFGSRIQSVAWGFIYILQPLVGVYYPVSILPPPIQKIAYLFPPTFVMESARSVRLTGVVRWDYLATAALLNVVYFCLAYIFMKRMWEWARHSGALAKMEE